MRFKAIITFWVTYMVSVMLGLCHDVPVHNKITEAAVSNSIGFSNYLGDNNISASKEYPGVISVNEGLFPIGPTPADLIMDGSGWEDNNDVAGDNGGHRSLNHFYDPIDDQGLSTPIPIANGIPSKVWGADFDAPNPHSSPDFNEYSWQNARAYQEGFITNVTSADRDAQAALMFRSIGQFTHLLEDASQPQHVRNEQHWDGVPFNFLGWESAFEDWGRDHIAEINFAPQQFDWVAAGFTKMWDFWDRELYNGTSFAPLDANQNGGPTLGLAEFCNGNFLTVRGSYAEYPQFAVSGGSTNYPYPSIYSTDFSHYQGNPAAYARLISVQNNGIYGGSTAVYRCIVAKTNQGIAVPEHCALDLLAAYRPHVFAVSPGTLCAVHPDDPDVLQCYHGFLIPQAIAYSTGLINYYFRGRLQIVSSSQNAQTCAFTVSNASPQPLSSGGFRVFSDDVSSNRTEATDLWTSYSEYLPSGGTVDGTFTVPCNSSGVFTLAFFGSVGTNDPVDTNACASIVFSNTPFVCSNLIPTNAVYDSNGNYMVTNLSPLDYYVMAPTPGMTWGTLYDIETCSSGDAIYFYTPTNSNVISAGAAAAGQPVRPGWIGTLGPSLIPCDATFDSNGNYTLNGLTAGNVYVAIPYVSAWQIQDEPIWPMGFFIAQSSSVVITGLPTNYMAGQPVLPGWLGSPCQCCAPVSQIWYRGITAASEWPLSTNGASASDMADLISYAQNYPLTNLQWGENLQANFSTPTNAAPTNFSGGGYPGCTSLWPFTYSSGFAEASVYQSLFLGGGNYFVIHAAMYTTPVASAATLVLLDGYEGTVICSPTGTLVQTPLTDGWNQCPAPYSDAGVSYETFVVPADGYTSLADFGAAIIQDPWYLGFDTGTGWPLTIQYGPSWP